AECLSLLEELQIVAECSLQSSMERPDSEQSLFGNYRRNVLTQHESAGIRRFELQPSFALYSGHRGKPACIRAANEHRSCDRRSVTPRCKKVTVVRACLGTAFRSQAAESS